LTSILIRPDVVPNVGRERASLIVQIRRKQEMERAADAESVKILRRCMGVDDFFLPKDRVRAETVRPIRAGPEKRIWRRGQSAQSCASLPLTEAKEI